MQQGWALGVAFMFLCSSVGSVTAEETKPTNAIRVVEATYGGNCTGVAKGNVTKFVASTCDGTDLCNYRVYYKNMGGDPAPGCKKAFRANYVCGKNRKPETCDLQAEAGMGGDDGEANHFCLLHCLTEGSHERSGKQTRRKAGIPVAGYDPRPRAVLCLYGCDLKRGLECTFHRTPHDTRAPARVSVSKPEIGSLGSAAGAGISHR
jgi:hypothetical protein